MAERIFQIELLDGSIVSLTTVAGLIEIELLDGTTIYLEVTP